MGMFWWQEYKNRIIAGIIMVVLGLAFFSWKNITEYAVDPHFDPQKEAAVRSANAAQYQELMDKFRLAQEEVKKNKTSAAAWLTIGLTASMFGDNVLAERAYQLTIRFDAFDFLARHNLAALYQEQGKYHAAFKLYQDILVVRPGDVQTYENMIDLYTQRKAGTLDDIKSSLERSLIATPDATAKENLKQLLEKL